MKKIFTSFLVMFLAITAMAQDLTYNVKSYCGKYYEGYTVTIDDAAVQAAIGCSMADASAFVVLPDGTESSNLLGGTDGWRNAEGAFQGWGAEAFYYVKADFSRESAQIYDMGGYPGNTGTPATYSAVYKLYNPADNSKSMKITINLNYVEIPVVNLSEYTKVTPNKSFSVEQYPRSNSSVTAYEFASDFKAVAKLGIDFKNNDIYDYLFVKQMDATTLMEMDQLVLFDDCWFQQLCDIEGNELTECSYDANDQDEYAKFQVSGVEFDGDTLRFSINQNPTKLGANETYKFTFFVVNPDTKQYAQINITFNVVPNPIPEVPFAEMKMVGEQDVNWKRSLPLGYTVEKIPVDVDGIASLFSYEGINSGDLRFKALMADNETLTDNYTTNSTEYGFWMDLESHPGAWSDFDANKTKSYFVNSNFLFSDGVFTIGHMPSVFEGGEIATGYLFLTYGQEYYRFNMHIQFGDEVDPNAKTPEDCETVATLAYEYQIVPNATDYQDEYMLSEAGMIDLGYDWLNEILELDSIEPAFYGMKEVVTDTVTNATGLVYSNAYSCDPQPGFWMIEPTGEYEFNTATVGTWGTNAFGVCYAGGVFQFFQYPGQRAVGDVYDADFYLCNLSPDVAKKVKVHFTVSFVESRQEVNVVGQSSYVIAASEDGEYTDIANLEEIYTAFGCDADEFDMAGELLAGKTTTTYVDKINGKYDDVYVGFPFGADGLLVDPEANPDDIAFYLGVEDGQFVATVMDEAILEGNKSFLCHLAFQYGDARYICNMTVTSKENADGIDRVVVKNVKDTNTYDLSGRLVNVPAKGLYIQNGKKVFVK